ncbi:Mov34/MPN/PAD-1 family protein [Sorangium sp. So ce1014]|uniref:Mov34/MPN/PAD-1 family protein n=1 Tax=Sorangium sp. So ce1014 TaxID=3133326 RepID=UPI003F643543
MNSGLVFKTYDGKRLKLDHAVIERLARYRQVAPKDREAGGVLLGRHLLDSSDLVVDEVTEPMRGDHRSRFAFRREQEGHQRRIDEVWKASRGTCVYLGEWHTHPEPIPEPSSIDVDDWIRRLRTDAFDGDALYFVIVGTRSVHAWSVARVNRAVHPMDLISTLRETGSWCCREAL